MSGAPPGTGSGQGTEGSSISDLGVVTGNIIDWSRVNHGFVRSRFGAVITFDAPRAGTGAGQGTAPTQNHNDDPGRGSPPRARHRSRGPSTTVPSSVL